MFSFNLTSFLYWNKTFSHLLSKNIFIIVDLQCSFNFCCTAMWPSYIYISHIFTHYPPSCSITGDRYCCLCYRARSHCLSTPHVIVLEFVSTNPKLPVHPTPSPSSSLLAKARLFSMSMIFSCRYVPLCHILDSKNKWYHIFVFLFLTYQLSRRVFSFIHVPANGIILFSLWLNRIPLCMCTTSP